MKKLKKVLVVDDDEIANFITGSLLESLDIIEKIDVVTDGKLGLEYLLKHCETPGMVCPELVILDDLMHEMNGLEMMKSLNSINFNHDTIFLLVGINTREEDAGKFRELGVQEIIHKPISEEDILKVYHKYWAEQESEKQE